MTLHAETSQLLERASAPLSLYNADWPEPVHAVDISVTGKNASLPPAKGHFMTCARMTVDNTENGLYASCHSGSTCHYQAAGYHWSIAIPPAHSDAQIREDLVDFLNLALTESWRELGWVPLHAASITSDKNCALLCATAGGGKSTLTASMIRRGWKTLGDDKLLLRTNEDGAVDVAALLHNFNLHPRTRDWFPEVGDLTGLPPYSPWTEKRKVRIESIWPGTTATRSRPTHLIEVARQSDTRGLKLTPLPHAKVLPLLMRQTVIPAHPAWAGQILATLAAAAARLQGWRIEIGDDAYERQDHLAELEELLQ
ncbi:MAG: hypothetical protein ABFS22_03130 [Pseudomonadota bacterium]